MIVPDSPAYGPLARTPNGGGVGDSTNRASVDLSVRCEVWCSLRATVQRQT